MEKDLCRSIVKRIGVGYARDRMQRAQQLLERIRLCDCIEFGGTRCSCVSRKRESTPLNGRNNSRDKGTQTEERTGASTVQYFRHLDREDAASPTVPRPIPTSLDVNRNLVSLAKRRHLSEDDAYDGIKNPFVLIVNNVNFWYEPQPRTGAEHDHDNVMSFVNKAGFETVVKRPDLPAKQLLNLLEEIRKSEVLVDYDSFICFIMSHGNEEGILGVDSIPVPVDDITAKFQGSKCPYLATKPKLFFLQACRGDVDDKGYLVPRGPGHVYPDSIDEMPVRLPSDADFLIAYSTTKGFVSNRRFADSVRVSETHGKILGSWFISCLVQILENYSGREDLMTMLTRVNRSMCREYSVPGGFKQISCQLSMLTKKVYFTNFNDQESAAVAAV